MNCRHCKNPLPRKGRRPKYCVYCGKTTSQLTPFRMWLLAFAVVGAVVVAPLLTLSLVSRGNGWHVSMPVDAGPEIRGIWGSSSSDVFAVGRGKTGLNIWHYDGRIWNPMLDGTEEWLTDFVSLLSVWGTSPADVFVAGTAREGYQGIGYGVVLHYDGEAWLMMDVDTTVSLMCIWGSSSSDVFAVGLDGTIYHYDGSIWSAMTSSTSEHLYSVWGSSSSDVFTVGGSGTILHYDGSTWSAMTSNTSKILLSVSGSSSSDVFAVGGFGTILHYDGSTWCPMTTSSTSEDLHGVWGNSSSEVFAVGTAVETQGLQNRYVRVVFRYNGSHWTRTTLDNGSQDYTWACIWGNSAHNVFVGGPGIMHYSN